MSRTTKSKLLRFEPRIKSITASVIPVSIVNLENTQAPANIMKTMHDIVAASVTAVFIIPGDWRRLTTMTRTANTKVATAPASVGLKNPENMPPKIMAAVTTIGQNVGITANRWRQVTPVIGIAFIVILIIVIHHGLYQQH